MEMYAQCNERTETQDKRRQEEVVKYADTLSRLRYHWFPAKKLKENGKGKMGSRSVASISKHGVMGSGHQGGINLKNIDIILKCF